ncbi:hypothetical protein ACH5RR_010661 [Cinchona calisaya]|uniref:Time for coffee n=1 Tax=Cinchona calisaya TaxID=153742 RepID=A0ABD3AJK2_9GENT
MEYMASLNGIGVAARRHRITFLRESTGVELQGMVRLRDRERVQKKDRDKNRDPSMISQSKRRRLGKYAPRITDKDVEGGGGEDSSAEDSFDEDFEEFDGGKAPLSTYHRTITLASAVRSSPVLRGSDQMIGVPVPRRARSATVKRSHEYWNSGTGRFGEEQSRRRLAPSALCRSINGFPPSYSSFPTRKKMRRVEPKTQIPKLASAEPSSSFQDDIEIEVAEALFDLMKQSQSQSQSQSSKKFERSSDNNSTGKFDSICNKAVDDKSTCSPITSAKIAPQASDLPQEMNFNSDSGSKKNGDEDGKDGESLKVSACNVPSNGIKAHNNSLPKLEKMSSTDIASDALKYKVENKVGKAKDPKDQAGESIGADEVVTRVQVVAPKEEESRSCATSNADDSTNSSVSKASSRADSVENRREAKFEIDLMAPLPMPSSPERERDGLTEISYGHKFVSPDVQMKNKTMSKDESLVFGRGHEEKQMQTICNQQEFTRLDFEKPHKINFCSRQLGQNEQIQCQVPLSEGLDFAQTNLLPFPIAATGWPGGYHPGNMAPFQTITPSDGSAKPSAALQPVPFQLFQPQPKRATMHQHIARSIRYHQQLTKNCTWPVAFGSATLYGSNTYSFNPAIPSAPNSILGKPVEGVLPGQVLAGKSCEVSNNMDAAKTKQLVLQQAPQQTQPGNLPHGPTSIFPLVQNQAPGGPTRLPGPSKSAKAVGKVCLSNNSAGGHSVSSSSSPSGMGAVSFNCSNLTVNEAPPFTAILQNSEYPFSISTNGGIPPHMKGTEAPILPFFNASYYPSMFHFTQVQQQQSISQPQPSCLHLVQLPPQAASTSSGSSSFHKRSHSQQQIGCQPSGRRSLSLAGMEQQQSQKQHVSAFPSSIKLDEEMSRRDSPIVVDSQESCAKRSSEGKNLAIPIHPMNVALMSHVALDSAGGNQHQYQQRKGSKCDMEVITPPAFAVSFGSAASSTQALNFSSVSQIPALFQMLPDLAKGGYQLVHAPQVVQHKNFEVSEEKSVVGAASNDNGKKAPAAGVDSVSKAAY